MRASRKSFRKRFGVSAHGESHFPNGLELVVAKIWKLTVQRNEHVRLLGHYYSVPHTYVGKKVTVFYTSQHVEIYQYYRLIAQHIRNYQGFGFITIKEHLPTAHRLYLEEDPTPYLKRTKEIDPVVEDFFQIVIERKKPLLAACKSCKGILYHLRIKLEKTDSLLPANMPINLVCITICQWPIFLPKDLTE